MVWRQMQSVNCVLDMRDTGTGMRMRHMPIGSLPRTVIFLTSISRTPPADPSSAFSSWMSARRCGLDEASDRHLANASVAARLHHAQSFRLVPRAHGKSVLRVRRASTRSVL